MKPIGTRWVGLSCALLLLLAGCGSASGRLPGAVTVVPTSASSGAETAGAEMLPAGWRWESYRGIEVGVPNSWGYGTTDEPWCLHQKDGTKVKPYVGRPGPVPAIGCALTNDGSDPARSVKTAGTFVWLGGPPVPDDGDRSGGDRQALTVDGAVVDVQAPAELRRQIVATIHRVTVDHHGCVADNPAVHDRNWRPARGVGVDDLTDVRSVAACKYDFADGRLIGSVELTGPDAARAVSAVAAAPVGGGPNDPGSCVKEYKYGDQIIVLVVEAAQGRREIALRYDGCDHHGFDDGSSVRTLTWLAVSPFVVDSNQVLSWSGVLDEILTPRN